MVRVCCNWSQKLAVSRTSVSYTYSTRCTRCSLLFNTCCKDGMRGTTDKRPHSNKSYQNLLWRTNIIEMYSTLMVLTERDFMYAHRTLTAYSYLCLLQPIKVNSCMQQPSSMPCYFQCKHSYSLSRNSKSIASMRRHKLRMQQQAPMDLSWSS